METMRSFSLPNHVSGCGWSMLTFRSAVDWRGECMGETGPFSTSESIPTAEGPSILEVDVCIVPD